MNTWKYCVNKQHIKIFNCKISDFITGEHENVIKMSEEKPLYVWYLGSGEKSFDLVCSEIVGEDVEI